MTGTLKQAQTRILAGTTTDNGTSYIHLKI